MLLEVSVLLRLQLSTALSLWVQQTSHHMTDASVPLQHLVNARCRQSAHLFSVPAHLTLVLEQSCRSLLSYAATPRYFCACVFIVPFASTWLPVLWSVELLALVWRHHLDRLFCNTSLCFWISALSCANVYEWSNVCSVSGVSMCSPLPPAPSARHTTVIWVVYRCVHRPTRACRALLFLPRSFSVPSCRLTRCCGSRKRSNNNNKRRELTVRKNNSRLQDSSLQELAKGIIVSLGGK